MTQRYPADHPVTPACNGARRALLWVLLGSTSLVAAACKSSPPEPEPRSKQEAQNVASDDSAADSQQQRLRDVLAKRHQEAKTLAKDRPHRAYAGPMKQTKESSGGDPVKGKFTLADATQGLPKEGKLVAEIKTAQGTLECELYEDKAPNTVANFVGLARGLRPFKDPKSDEWVKRPAYDGTVFHRIIKGFMIQGGDPTGTGRGEPGYVIADEIWEGSKHDQRGLICMANRGPNTNGMQFFIMDGAKSHLDGGYTIFGKCSPDSLIEKLASSETIGDKAVNPPVMEKVSVKRVK